MLRNRLILLIAIIAAGTFASFYGGNIPYTLFWLTLAVPVIALLYTFYVYLRVKVYQQIDQMVIVKGETSGYTFRVANEDFVAYQDMKIHFFTGMSTVEGTQEDMSYCLLPGEDVSFETRLRCHYRGVYQVGARSIEITDPFNLFRLPYPIRSRNSVTVLPRRVHLDTLNILPEEEDAKNARYQPRAREEEPDIEMRKYAPGDSRRLIHWKATARRGELMSRRFTENTRQGVRLCMDLTPTRLKDWQERAETEDQIIEIGISIADYCLTHRIPCAAWYALEKKPEKAFCQTDAEFELFYGRCGKLAFDAQLEIGDLLGQASALEAGTFRYVVVTHALTGGLYSTAVRACAGGNDVTVVLLEDNLDDEERRIRAYMAEASIPVVQIPRDQEFAQAFARRQGGGL